MLMHKYYKDTKLLSVFICFFRTFATVMKQLAGRPLGACALATGSLPPW